MFNANNYGYNPYNRYNQQPSYQQPMQQPDFNNVQNRSGLPGKYVDSLETAKNSEYNLDGSINFFVLTDNSRIVTKQLQNDGTTKLTIFKPSNEQKEDIKYITKEDMKKAIKDIDLSVIDDIKDELKDLQKEIKELKKKKKNE